MMDFVDGKACTPHEDESEVRFDFHLYPSPRLLWKTRIGNDYGGARPQVVNGRIYAYDQEGHLLVLDAATGGVQERRPLLDGVAHQTPWVEGEIIYLSAKKHGERGAYLCAYNLRRDTLLWAKQNRFNWGAPLALDGVVWVRTTDNVVYAMSASDGKTKWTHRLRREDWYGLPLTVVDETVYVGGESKAGFDTEGYVLALNGMTGDVQWMYTTGGKVWFTPIVADGRVYVSDVGFDVNDASFDGTDVYCLSATPRSRLGEGLWRYNLEGIAQQGTVASDTVYWGCYQGYLYALDAGTGQLRWRFQAGAPVAVDGPPCVMGGWIFVGSGDGYLYGLDARTGALRWKYFVVDDDALQAEVEKEERREEDEDEEDLDLFAWAAEGRLYMLTTQGFLHCFEFPETAPGKEITL